MGNAPNDSKIQSIEPPRVRATRVGRTSAGGSPDGKGMLDNLLENVGLAKESGGSA